MSKKAPIKIPNLYPTKKLTIAGNEVIISAFKASDKVYDIAIEHLKREGLELQSKINKIIYEEKEVEGVKTPVRKNDTEFSKKERDDLYKLMNDVNDLEYKMIYGDKDSSDPDDERLEGPMALLAQRGLKRYYHPDKNSSELDMIDDIPITEGDVKLIVNTMINLTKPPSGLEQSIREKQKEIEQRERDAGKGKSEE